MSAFVPFVDLKPLVHAVRAEALEDFASILTSAEFVQGEKVARFESLLAQALDANHVVACSSGSDALVLALRALGVKRGMKIAIPNMTFWATYEAVIHTGATPVLIDIDPDDLHMSLDEFQRAHTRFHLDGAIFVHLFGWTSARLFDFRAFCKDRTIFLLEDGAQAFGVKREGRSVFADAEVATLSFYPAKVLGGAMDGGAVVTDSPGTRERLASLRNHGRTRHYSFADVGYNARMSALQGAYLSRVLPLAPEILHSRRRAVHCYRELLHGAPGVRVHAPPHGVEENGYLNILTLENPDRVARRLEQDRIGFARTYPEPIHEQPPAKGALRVGELSESRAFCRRVLNLPVFFGIEPEQCERAAASLLCALHEV